MVEVIRSNPVGSLCSCMIADRKSTRLNSSHVRSSYAVFCLKTPPSPPTSPLFPYTTLFRSGDIHALLHRVDMATGKLHIHLQVGIAAHELANHGTEQQLAEFDGRGNPQQSGGLALQLHDRRSEEHTSELQSRPQLVCRLLLENTTVASYISTLSLHDALPIWRYPRPPPPGRYGDW